VIIGSRALIGLPEPPATRSLQPPNLGEILVHYTGVFGYPADPMADLRYARSVAYYGLNREPPWPYEYNYLIGPGGGVFEQAGDYRPSHCLNWNLDSIGVLFMLGIGVHPTGAMIESFHDLCDRLVARGRLARHHRRLPHYARRWTSCSGNTTAEIPRGVRAGSPTGQGSNGELIPALLQRGDVIPTPPPTPTPEPTPTPTEDFTVYLGLCKFETHDAVYALYSDGTKKWIAPGAGQVFRGLKQMAGESTVMSIVYDPNVMRALGPIVGPAPTGVDVYGVPG
jgi:hypothetical protein